MKRLTLIVFMTAAISCRLAASPGQQQIDQKRQKEIRAALVAHGYPGGVNWEDTKKILKQIAKDHYWQGSHVPDTRVLLLLDLMPKGDKQVLDLPPSRLEPGLLANKNYAERRK
jgi:hypothetical protein